MTILVGYGTSPQARAAVERAIEEARLRGVRLHVAAVAQHEVADSPTRVRDEYAAVGALERELATLHRRLEREGLDVEVEVIHGRRGEVSRHLLEAARALHAELLVIGMRRRTPVGKLVMGSVAQDLILQAPCPVLAVKAPRDEPSRDGSRDEHVRGEAGAS